MHTEETKKCFQGLVEKFLAIIPKEDRKSFNRIGFHVEAAWWFYMDFCRPAAPSLPNMNLRHFAKTLLARYPSLLKPFGGMPNIERLLDGFFAYRSQIPVCGAAIFDHAKERLLLVRGIHSSAKWSFPRGKMNAHESAAACAVREVYEEVGYDVSPLIDDQCKLEWIKPSQHPIRIYIVCLPKDDEKYAFAPKTLGEIGQIGWHRLESLQKRPKLYYDVGQFTKDLLLFASSSTLPSAKIRRPKAPQILKEAERSVMKMKRVPLSELFPPETSGPFAEHSQQVSEIKEDPALYAHEMADELLLADWFPKTSLSSKPMDSEEIQQLKSLLLNPTEDELNDDHSEEQNKIEPEYIRDQQNIVTDIAPQLSYSSLPVSFSNDQDDLLSLLLKKK